MSDIFLKLTEPSIKAIKDILIWGKNNSLDTAVTMLDMNISIGRLPSDLDFNSALGLLSDSAIDYFRIILRKEMNLYFVSDTLEGNDDILEIGIRNLNLNGKEYFIRLYLKKEMLEELKKKYQLIAY